MGKKIFKLFIPLVPLLLGIALKISIFDEIPKSKTEQIEFMISNYLKPLWLELLTISYLLPIGFLSGDSPTLKQRLTIYFNPVITFIVILFFILALPKFGLKSDLWIIYIPGVLGLFSMFINQSIIIKD